MVEEEEVKLESIVIEILAALCATQENGEIVLDYDEIYAVQTQPGHLDITPDNEAQKLSVKVVNE